MRKERRAGFAHGDIPPPAPPTLTTTTELSPPSCTLKSVTHVLGLKCHLCARSLTGSRTAGGKQAVGWRAVHDDADDDAATY